MTDDPFYDHGNAIHRMVFRSILHVVKLPDTMVVAELLKGTTTNWRPEELKPYYLPQEIAAFFAARRRVLRILIQYGKDAQIILDTLNTAENGNQDV